MHEVFDLPMMSEIWSKTENVWGINIPKKPLYHYTSSVLTVQSMLTVKELWLSKYTVMNDYSEIQYGISLIEDMMICRAKNDSRFINLKESFHKYIMKEITDYFIMSFSLNENSRLLWDSYAQKKGFCIEFSSEFISDLVFNTPVKKLVLSDGKFVEEKTGKRKIYIKKNEIVTNGKGYGQEVLANQVLYDEKKQKQLLIEIMDYITRKMDLNCNADINIAINALAQTIPFFKDPSLRDENEYRLVIHVSPMKENRSDKKEYLSSIQYYREVNNKLFPYIKLQMETAEYIKSVALGYLNNDILAKETMKEFLATLPQNVELRDVNYPLRW